MNMTISTTVWKYGFCLFIVLITSIDVALISCGTITLGTAGSVEGACIIMSIGFFVMTVCFVGCFATLKDSYLLSMIYVIFLLLGITMETVFMIGLAIMKQDLMEATADRVNGNWNQQQIETGAMNPMQEMYSCCGKDGPDDYLVLADDELPKSCCDQSNCLDDDNVFTKGCASEVVNFFDDHCDDLMLIIVGTIALEILGVICAYYFAKCLRLEYEKPKETANGD